MTDWEKYLKKRSDNIGFISRLGAFREPTPAEIARAIMIETESWQNTRGKKPYKVSAEYSAPKRNYGFDAPVQHPKRKEAIKAYIETPIDIGRETWLFMDWWTAIKHWLKKNKVKKERKDIK